tara:strand:+ start:414 stop:737 length:324 start_codon:yes stop_codon:yes gene_type:complete
MDKTQLYIIRQSSLNRATDLYSKKDAWNEEQIIETAKVFEQYVLGGEQLNSLPEIPKVADPDKKWLNKNTPDFNVAIEFIKKGYAVKDIRNKYKVSKEVEQELNKIN